MGNITNRKEKKTFNRDRYFTPKWIIEAARKTMGSINLDPASEEIANRTVQAETIFTKAENGLALEWFGNVWLNPPFSRPNCEKFISRAIWSYESGKIDRMCIITNASTSSKWCQEILLAADSCCFLEKRVEFYHPELSEMIKRGEAKKTGNFVGQIVWFFGDALSNLKFSREFANAGALVPLPKYTRGGN